MLQKINNYLKTFEREDLLFKRWDVSPMSQQLHQAMYRRYPLNEKYYFELNPSFVYEYKDIQSMLIFPFVMLRDGFLGLFYFFIKNPRPPEKCQTTFLIPERFSYLAPEIWKDHVLFYSFEFLNNSQSEKKKNIIYGSINRESFLKETVEEKVKKISNVDETLVILIHWGQGYLASRSETEIHHSFQKALYQHIGFDLKIYNEFRPEAFTFVDQTYQYENVDNDNFIIYDDYLTHFFSSAGALNNNKKEKSKMDVVTSINLSPFHKINIGQVSNLSNEILENIFEIKTKKIILNLTSEKFYDYALDVFKDKL